MRFIDTVFFPAQLVNNYEYLYLQLSMHSGGYVFRKPCLMLLLTKDALEKTVNAISVFLFIFYFYGDCILLISEIL